jgi:hypothetical protein
MSPPEPDDTGPTPAQRPRSVVTTSRSSPLVGITPTPAQDPPAEELGEHLLRPCFTGTLAPGQLPWSPGGELGAGACAHTRRRCQRRPSSALDTRASDAPANGGPSLPRQARFGQRRASRSPTTATRRTWCERWPAPPHRCIPDPARCGQLGCRGRGHRTPGHRSRGHRSPGHRSPGHRSPGHRTSARAVGWTDVRTADSGRGPSDERRGRRPDILDGHDGWAAQTSLGLQRLRRSATHDSSAVTPPAAAVTGSCAAPLDKPRLGALLSCVGVGGYEGRAMGLRKGEGVQGWSGEAVLMGVADESWERAGLWMRM